MFWMCLHLLSCFATRSPSLECAALYLFWRALTHWSRSPKVAIHLYACNMVATIKMSQGQLVSLYRDKTTCYSSDEFQSFKNLFDCFHEVGFRSERSQAWALIRGEGSYFMGLPWSYICCGPSFSGWQAKVTSLGGACSIRMLMWVNSPLWLCSGELILVGNEGIYVWVLFGSFLMFSNLYLDLVMVIQSACLLIS